MTKMRAGVGKRPEVADVLFEIGQRAASSEGLSAVATFAIEQTSRLLRADQVALLQIDGSSLLPIAAWGWPGDLRAQLEGDQVRVDSEQASDAGVDPRSWMCADVTVEGRRWAIVAVHKAFGARRTQGAERALGVVAQILQTTTELELLRRRLSHGLSHDSLTGLPNRDQFVERVRDAQGYDLDESSIRAVICLDMDRFFEINHAVGYAAGDGLLSDAAARLRRALRPGDEAARQIGDRFLVLAQALPSEAAALAEAERLRRGITGAVKVGSRDVVVGASAGVALDDQHCSAEELIWEAELAMFHAKDAGRNRVAVFEPSFHDRISIGRHLEIDLRDAIEHDRLVMHYQPIIDLTDRTVIQAEALIRWMHPERGLIQPADFMPLAEESRVVAPLANWILNTACLHARQWLELAESLDLKAPGVSVNLSARELTDVGLVDRVAAALGYAALPAEQLTLEVSEAVMMSDSDRVAAAMRQLHEMGVRLAIDDFGTGYSSLAHLRRFPTDAIKIDRPFVAGLGSDPDDSVVVAGILALARALDVEAVAEGVETEAQAQELGRLGCRVVQGFLYARPEPHEAMAARISADRGGPGGRPRLPSLLPS